MPAGVYNITVEQGATWDLTITWRESGELVDTTGFSARSQARDGPTLLWDLSTADGSILLGLGTVSLTVDAALTRALPDAVSRLARYDVEVYRPGGRITRLLEGKFSVSPEVTDES